MSHQSRPWKNWKLVALFLILAAPILMLFGARYVYKPYSIPAESMLPTLEVGDRIVAKMRDVGNIRRGDIMIINNGSVDYVKRVAAIPGDTIEVVDGVVVLNGKPVTQKLIATKIVESEYLGSQTARILEEQFPGEAKPHQIMDLGQSTGDTFGPMHLGQDGWFFLGDNRDNSADSRFTSERGGLGGAVARDRIKGGVTLVLWSKRDGFVKRAF